MTTDAHKQQMEAEQLEMMEYILLGMGFISTIMSFVLPKILAGAAQQAADPWGPYFTRKVLSWALSESIAIYGLVLYFMAGDHQTMAIFVVWAGVLMAVHSPRDIPS